MSFVFLIGCPTTTDITTLYADGASRATALAAHDPSHGAVAFVAETTHPDNDPAGPFGPFSPGDAVTFYGSMTGQSGGIQSATVNTSATGTGLDGNPVDGYLIVVPEPDDGGLDFNVFVLASALRLAS